MPGVAWILWGTDLPRMAYFPTGRNSWPHSILLWVHWHKTNFYHLFSWNKNQPLWSSGCIEWDRTYWTRRMDTFNRKKISVKQHGGLSLLCCLSWQDVKFNYSGDKKYYFVISICVIASVCQPSRSRRSSAAASTRLVRVLLCCKLDQRHFNQLFKIHKG